MDDQALVEGSVVFKDEDDPIIKIEIDHRTVCKNCKNIKRLNMSAESNKGSFPLFLVLILNQRQVVASMFNVRKHPTLTHHKQSSFHYCSG